MMLLWLFRKYRLLAILIVFLGHSDLYASFQQRARDYGIHIGVLPTGEYNAITDIAGVEVGHTTLINDSTVRTGVTVIKPHQGNVFLDKVPAALFVGNGFGKLAGATQIEELGNIETPIVLTNTLNVGAMVAAMVDYTLGLEGMEYVRSVNAVVGETNDGFLNNIRRPAVTKDHLMEALASASSGPVPEGNVGAGTGTVCFGFKGGIGTSSRVLPEALGGYTVGVLVQSNFGGSLRIDGAPVGEALGVYYLSEQLESADGSCMIVVATDAPILNRNLKRLAYRAMFGLARAGGLGSNGSGDYVLAFSTNQSVRSAYKSKYMEPAEIGTNNIMSPLFAAVVEATEEAIINSLLAAQSMIGYRRRSIEALPMDQVMPILKNHGVVE
jgi:D-aminopeptidase